MPLKTVVPMALRLPAAITMGMTPGIKVREVISTGLKRIRPPSTAASAMDNPCSRRSLANSTEIKIVNIARSRMGLQGREYFADRNLEIFSPGAVDVQEYLGRVGRIGAVNPAQSRILIGSDHHAHGNGSNLLWTLAFQCLQPEIKSDGRAQPLDGRRHKCKAVCCGKGGRLPLGLAEYAVQLQIRALTFIPWGQYCNAESESAGQ